MLARSCDSFASLKSTRACVWSGTYAFLCISRDIHEHKRLTYVDREGVKIILNNMTPSFAYFFVLFLLFCFIASATLVVQVYNVVRLGFDIRSPDAIGYAFN